MVTDIFGQELSVGDYVLTADGTSFHLKRVYKVITNHNHKRLRVEWYSYSGKRYSKMIYGPQTSVIKVAPEQIETLPFFSRAWVNIL